MGTQTRPNTWTGFKIRNLPVTQNKQNIEAKIQMIQLMHERTRLQEPRSELHNKLSLNKIERQPMGSWLIW